MAARLACAGAPSGSGACAGGSRGGRRPRSSGSRRRGARRATRQPRAGRGRAEHAVRRTPRAPRSAGRAGARASRGRGTTRPGRRPRRARPAPRAGCGRARSRTRAGRRRRGSTGAAPATSRGERERLLLAVGREEECGPVAARRREVARARARRARARDGETASASASSSRRPRAGLRSVRSGRARTRPCAGRARGRRAGRARDPRAGRPRAGARQTRRRGGGRARGERRLPVVEHEAVLLGEARRPASPRAAATCPPPRPPAARARPRTSEPRAVAARRRPGPASSTRASEQPTCSPSTRAAPARRAPSRTACASRSCTASARSSRAELLVRQLGGDRLRQRDERHLVGDGEDGEAEPSASCDERLRRLREAEARAEGEPGEPVPARAGGRTRAAAGVSWPTPSPVVIRSSPPSSHGVGSASSETCSQRTSLPLAGRPRRRSSPRPGRSVMSRTVSIACAGSLGRRGQDATPAPGATRVRNRDLRHRVQERAV